MEKQVKLIGVGWKDATPAREIKVGDTLVWNYGYTSKVLDIVSETAKQIVIRTESEDGKHYLRRLGKSTLVVVATKDKKRFVLDKPEVGMCEVEGKMYFCYNPHTNHTRYFAKKEECETYVRDNFEGNMKKHLILCLKKEKRQASIARK